MATSLQTLLTRIGQETGDTTNPTSTNQKRTISLNAVMDELSTETNFDFQKKRVRFTHVDDPPYNAYGLSAVLGVTDFEDADDLRLEDNHTVEFEHVKPDRLEVLSGLGRASPPSFAEEWNTGSVFLRVLFGSGETNSVIDSCDTLNEAGANWTAGGSLSSPVADTVYRKLGAGSVRFTLTGNSTGTLEKTHTSALDFRDFVARSAFRLSIRPSPAPRSPTASYVSARTPLTTTRSRPRPSQTAPPLSTIGREPPFHGRRRLPPRERLICKMWTTSSCVLPIRRRSPTSGSTIFALSRVLR